MPTIPFTNYRRPHGQQEETEMEVSQEAWDKAQLILEQEFRFESEYLSTGDWSFTIASDETGDAAIEILFRSQIGDDPVASARASVEKMIREFRL